MPCDTYVRREQTAEERAAEVVAALDKLRASLESGQARYVLSPDGAVAIAGWTGDERGGLSDVCAFRAMTVDGSWEHRQAVQRAESEAGRSVNMEMVAAGVHSHDGGGTWHGGH